MDQQERRGQTGKHEAGHLVAFAAFGKPEGLISLRVRRDSWSGYIKFYPSFFPTQYLAHLDLAGLIAELYFDRPLAEWVPFRNPRFADIRDFGKHVWDVEGEVLGDFFPGIPTMIAKMLGLVPALRTLIVIEETLAVLEANRHILEGIVAQMMKRVQLNSKDVRFWGNLVIPWSKVSSSS